MLVNNQLRTCYLWILVILTFLVPATSLGNNIPQTDLYLQAKQAVKQGNWVLCENLEAQLSDYPLLPYLEYYQIVAKINTVNDDTIQQFILKYQASPLAQRLRNAWLNHLAQQKNWTLFLKYYQPSDNTALQCFYLTALQQLGKNKTIDSQIMPIWLIGSSQPSACDLVFDLWLSNNPVKEQLLWQRFELSLKSYNFGLANYLSEKMSSANQTAAKAIIQLYRRPDLVNSKEFQKKYPSPEILSYGIARLAHRDPIAAVRSWNTLKNKFTFNPIQQQRIFQAIALKFALKKDSQALIWYRKVVNDNLDPVYQDWLIRIGLYFHDWQLVKERINAMPEMERNKSQWQYWYARSLNALGDKDQAFKIFTQLSKERSYYGFLATQYTFNPIKLVNKSLLLTAAEITTVEQLPGFQRAELLFSVNQKYDAMLEILYLIKALNNKQQYIVTKLIANWQWYPISLLISNKIAYTGDLNLRFPLLYQQAIVNNAKLQNINPALIYALIKQESYFNCNAVSPAGALGLMQLMPSTALKTAKQFQIKYNDTAELLSAKLNICFGSAYLRNSLNKFEDNPILAIATYNAGPEAVNRWLKQGHVTNADIWIESIPYQETRNYLKNVIANYIVYQSRLGQIPDIKTIMPNIGQ